MNTREIHKHSFRLIFIQSVLVLSITSLSYVNADGGKVYSVYDTNKDGYLERTEYKKFFESKQKRSKNLSIWEFDHVDSNQDEKISEQEMVNTLMKNFKK
jgi:hypothetical protein